MSYDELFNPTEEHLALREMVAEFTRNEVEPRAAASDERGTLDTELALPVPPWVHGASRWMAGSSILVVGLAFSVMLFDAILGVHDPRSLVLHGSAAILSSVAIGIVVIGKHGLKSGFAGPMSAGLVVVVSLLSMGLSQPSVAEWLPVASLLARSSSGVTPMLLSVVLGIASVGIFTFRTARG